MSTGSETLAVPDGFDSVGFRRALGSFLTGVTIVTTRDETGAPRGFTANSFTSVSLDPPLVLVCIGDHAFSYETFATCDRFAINVLGADDRDMSNLFASKAPDKFERVAWRPGGDGTPLIEGAIGVFDCTTHDRVVAGDHVILVGLVQDFGAGEGAPLGFHRGGYVALREAEDAVRAIDAGTVRVGAIVEKHGAVLLDRVAGGLRLPRAARLGTADGSEDGSLHAALSERGVSVNLRHVFAAYEDGATQCLFYRGETEAGDETLFTDLATLDWAQIADPAERSMLRRYDQERRTMGFGIYVGGAVSGDVHRLAGSKSETEGRY